MKIELFVLINLFHLAFSDQLTLIIVIRSQANSFHSGLAQALLENIDLQAKYLDTGTVKVVQAHKEWSDNIDKAWAILPVIPSLVEKHGSNADWVMFVEDNTEIRLANLLKFLTKFNSKEDHLLARGLFDNDITIIHHFSMFTAKDGSKFLYPDFASGWILSRNLMLKMQQDISERKFESDFQIDLKHEIAKYLQKSFSVEVTHAPEFCGAGEENEKCITTVRRELEDCGSKYNVDDIFFAVKSTEKFHKDRLAVLKKTWLPRTKLVTIYSNVTDPSIPTVDCGVPNTERGHCGKTNAILKDFYERQDLKQVPWLFIADDDTILSVSRVIKFLSCYNHDDAIFMGEKYGYGLLSQYGYSYITGGGGMIFSRSAVKAWLSECSCPSDDTPDDMYLGQCLYFRAGLVSTHSPLFHQARPDDYAVGYLANQVPLSFHKHWNNDPVKVYKQWFEESDSVLEKHSHPTTFVLTSTIPDVVPSPLPPTPTEDQVKDEL